MKTQHLDDIIDGSNVNTNESQLNREKISSNQQDNYSQNSSGKVGAFWIMEDKNGVEFLSGNIKIPENYKGEELPIVVFPNKFYSKERKTPMFCIYRPDL